MVLRASLAMMALITPTFLIAQAPPTQPTPNAAPIVRATPLSATLRPPINLVREALASLNIDKWKANSAIKNEAQGNLQSIQRDIENTLPGLVTAADADPLSVSKALPVFRNVDALYDVMLRLDSAGRLAAPKDQMNALDTALSSLSDARRTVGDQLQSTADNQEGRIAHLQAQLKAVPAAAPPPAPVTCPPPPTTTKKRSKPKTKSSTSTQTAPATH